MVFYAFFSECMLYAYAWAAQIVTANNDNEYCSYINASALNFTPNLDKQIITPTILIQVWYEHFILRNRGDNFKNYLSVVSYQKKKLSIVNHSMCSHLSLFILSFSQSLRQLLANHLRRLQQTVLRLFS